MLFRVLLFDTVCLPLCFLFFSFKQVIFRSIGKGKEVDDPYSPEALALLTLTNLRIRLLKPQACAGPNLETRPGVFSVATKRRSVPSRPVPYAIYSFLARGTCLCHGHAEHCLPTQQDTDQLPPEGMVRESCQPDHIRSPPLMVCACVKCDFCLCDVIVLVCGFVCVCVSLCDSVCLLWLWLPNGRCLAGVCARTTLRESTVKGALPSITTGHGSLPTAATGSRTPARVSSLPR